MLLAVEFLDELVFGAREAAWPLIRRDLGLSYAQIGLLLSFPDLVASLIEPAFGVLGDAGRRRTIILWGGAAFAVSLAFVSVAGGFVALLLPMLALSPASGAFVSLSQASLMDLEPGTKAQERSMARWVIAGSFGVVVGPLALAGAVVTGAGWRAVFLCMAALSVPAILVVRHAPLEGARRPVRHAAREALQAIRRRQVLRWLILLELTDLVGDVLYGFLALYFVDVAGSTASQAALAVGVWSLAGLIGDWLLLPVLRRADGLRYLAWSAAAVTVVYPAFLLVPGLAPKLLLVAAMGMLHAGWYAIPMARLYGELPGASGTVVALSNVSGLAGSLVPLGLGLLAQRFGLSAAMWALLAGPLVLLLWLPRPETRSVRQ